MNTYREQMLQSLRAAHIRTPEGVYVRDLTLRPQLATVEKWRDNKISVAELCERTGWTVSEPLDTDCIDQDGSNYGEEHDTSGLPAGMGMTLPVCPDCHRPVPATAAQCPGWHGDDMWHRGCWDWANDRSCD